MVQSDRRGAQPPLQTEVRIVGRTEGDVVQRSRARQEVLGQGRPVVGGVFLVADDHDAAVVGLVPKGARSREAGQGGADHGDRGAHAAPSATVPAGCVTPNVQGNTYYLCGNTWFQPSYGANGVYYRVVPSP